MDKQVAYLPKVGYQGWLCTVCFAKAERDRHLPCFVCLRPNCESQQAEWVDEVQ
jgi:hypothetical protein